MPSETNQSIGVEGFSSRSFHKLSSTHCAVGLETPSRFSLTKWKIEKIEQKM